LAVLALIGAARLQAQDVPAKEPLLIGANWDAGDNDAVKKIFYDAGFNLARTGGGYGWNRARNEKDVAEFEARGVKVIYQLASHYPSADYFKFRDSWFVDQAGKTGEEDRNAWAISYSGQNWPQYSYASTEIRPQFEKDFAESLSAIKQHGNVAGLMLHNEPGLFWLRDRMFDYSTPALHAFRDWLKGRYGQVGRLNETWGAQFASFDVVDPPHRLPPVDNIAAWLDWRRANAVMTHDFLQWEIAFARREWPGMPLMTNAAGPLDNWYPMRCADSFLDSEGFDVVGVDIYPTQSRAPYQAYAMATTCGVAQDRPVYVCECDVYDSEKWPGLSEAQRADLLRAAVWSYIGHGARAVCLWSLSGGGGYALTHGEFSPRVATVREITQLARTLNLGAYRKPAPRVAIVMDPDSFLYYAGLEKEPPWFLDKTGLGMLEALADGGHEADVILTEQVRRGQAAGYRALVLSVQVMMDEELAERLTEFVREGGLLMAESPFAEVDLSGRGLPGKPGCGLDRLFGVRIAKTTRGDPGVINTDAGVITGWGFHSEVQPDGAEVIGRFADGAPAVTRNKFGKGSAVFVGACLSLPYGDGWAQPGLAELLTQQLEQAGVQAPFAVSHAGKCFLDVSSLADAKGNRIFILAVPPANGKPQEPAREVTIALPAEEARGLAGAWAFLPAGEEAGRAAHSVPKVVAVEWGDAVGRFRLGDISSAALLLLARDAPSSVGVETSAVDGALEKAEERQR
jgi:hypothetical protein